MIFVRDKVVRLGSPKTHREICSSKLTAELVKSSLWWDIEIMMVDRAAGIIADSVEVCLGEIK